MAKTKLQFLKGIKDAPLYMELSDWFMKQGNDLMSHELIAKQMKVIRFKYHHPRGNEPIRQRDLSSWIKQCRFDLEHRYRCTLYNVLGSGYKVATPRELAIYTAKFARRTLMYADRTYRLCEIVDRKHMPAAIREVFFDQAGKIKRFKSTGRGFMQTFAGFLVEERKRIEKEKNDHEKTQQKNGTKRQGRKNRSQIPV